MCFEAGVYLVWWTFWQRGNTRLTVTCYLMITCNLRFLRTIMVTCLNYVHCRRVTLCASLGYRDFHFLAAW